MRTILFLTIASLAIACGKGGNAVPSSRDGLIDNWKKAGLNPSAFTAAQTQVGKDCASGTINNVDVLVCSFDSEADAKAAEDKGLAWVGDTTGTSQARGKMVIAAADRHKADPSGRTINQLMKAAGK